MVGEQLPAAQGLPAANHSPQAQTEGHQHQGLKVFAPQPAGDVSPHALVL